MQSKSKNDKKHDKNKMAIRKMIEQDQSRDKEEEKKEESSSDSDEEEKKKQDKQDEQPTEVNL